MSPGSGDPQQPSTAVAAMPTNAATSPTMTRTIETTATLRGGDPDGGPGTSNTSTFAGVDVPRERGQALVPLEAVTDAVVDFVADDSLAGRVVLLEREAEPRWLN